MNDKQKTAAYTTLAILVAFALMALGKWAYNRYQANKATANANANRGTASSEDDDMEEAQANRQAA